MNLESDIAFGDEFLHELEGDIGGRAFLASVATAAKREEPAPASLTVKATGKPASEKAGRADKAAALTGPRALSLGGRDRARRWAA